eukprot:4453939-Heterocapsa_arctica.AAC.1
MPPPWEAWPLPLSPLSFFIFLLQVDGQLQNWGWGGQVVFDVENRSASSSCRWQTGHSVTVMGFTSYGHQALSTLH